jgi:hypothetical protein
MMLAVFALEETCFWKLWDLPQMVTESADKRLSLHTADTITLVGATIARAWIRDRVRVVGLTLVVVRDGDSLLQAVLGTWCWELQLDATDL